MIEVNDSNCTINEVKLEFIECPTLFQKPQSSGGYSLVQINSKKPKCAVTIKDEEYEYTSVPIATVTLDTDDIAQNVLNYGMAPIDFKIKLDFNDANDLLNYEQPSEEENVSVIETSIDLLNYNETSCVESHVNEVYKCKICSRFFKTKELQLKHVELHADEKIQMHIDEINYNCDVCNNCLTTKHYMLEYVKAHTGKTSYKCVICAKCFTSKQCLAVHVKTHASEGNHKCGTCNKCFTIKQHTTKHQLSRHVKTHTGERNYKCDICSELFTTKRSMLRHLKTHIHESNYKCAICNESFGAKYYMLEHVKATHKFHQMKESSYATITQNTS